MNYTRGGAITINQVTRFTRDIDFGSVGHYYILEQDEAQILSVENNSILSTHKTGDGSITYYGIIDSESDFALNPDYPVFWSNLVYYLAGRAEMAEINLKTGSILEAGEENFIMDKTGYFQLGNKRIAVNLINEKESNINYKPDISINNAKGELQKIKSNVDYKLSVYIGITVLILVLVEFYYIKKRGEI